MKFRESFIWLVLVSLVLVIMIHELMTKNEPKVEKVSHHQTEMRKSPPVFISISGGLGNQLFQYAAAYAAAKKRNSDLYIFAFNDEPNTYLLNQFNVPQDKVLPPNPSAYFNQNQFVEDEFEMKYGKVKSHIATEENLLQGNLPVDQMLYFGEYFASNIFFESEKSDILNLFQPTFDTQPIEHLKSLISSTENSVSVHIQRGNFSQQDDFPSISLSYQKEAMQLIKQKLQTNDVTFFVFTDDLDYVRKHLDDESDGNDGPNNIIYMSNLTIDKTMYGFVLMSLCKHNIITNTAFSWWAAYLNKNLDKIVVAPMPKYKPEWIKENYPSNHNKLLITDFAYPKGWLTIAPKFLNSSHHE